MSMEKDDAATVVEDPSDKVPEPPKEMIGEYMNPALFSPVPKKGNTSRIVVEKPYQTVAIDLADMVQVRDANDGYSYLLVCTDVFSRYVYHHLLKTKGMHEIINAFDAIFKKGMPVPQNIFSDQEAAVWSGPMKEYFDSKKIHLYHTGTHAVPAEVSIKRIKKILYMYMYTNDTNKWYDVIDRVVDQTNHTVIKSVGLSPAEMRTPVMEGVVRDMFMNPQPKKLTRREKILWDMLKEGSHVYITRDKLAFEKGYDPNFSEEEFIVTNKRVDNDGVPIFYLKDRFGEVIENGFYAHELMPIDPETKKSIYPTN